MELPLMKLRLMALTDQLYFDLYVRIQNKSDIPSPAQYFSVMIYNEEDLQEYRDESLDISDNPLLRYFRSR